MQQIIFDIDGTLADTKNVDDKCFTRALETTFGVEISGVNWSSFEHVTDWGITEEIILNKLHRKPTDMEYEIMNSALVSEFQKEKELDADQFKEVPGAVAFFNHLRESGKHKLGIATGARKDSAVIKLNTIGLEINGIAFCSSSSFKSREDITKDVMNKLSENHDLSKQRIVYFGDGIWDYKTCMNLGIDFIGIDIIRDKKLENLGASHVFRDFQNIESIIKVLEII